MEPSGGEARAERDIFPPAPSLDRIADHLEGQGGRGVFSPAAGQACGITDCQILGDFFEFRPYPFACSGSFFSGRHGIRFQDQKFHEGLEKNKNFEFQQKEIGQKIQNQILLKFFVFAVVPEIPFLNL